MTVAPAVGMKLTNLRRLRGREWLWRNEQMPLAPPRPGTSFVETADSGGWDECFPTVAPSPVPGAPAGTPSLPDHGELWSAAWTSSVFEHVGRHHAHRLRARLASSPTNSTASSRSIPHEPLLRMRYRLRNTGGAPFPWIWSRPSAVQRPARDHARAPTMRQVRLDAVHGVPS